jgi:glycosyltransferase involved in cell wall biosynthesis
MIGASGLSSAVEFLGYVDAHAMANALSLSHVFVIPSYIENSPNSLCEAMQVGVPCVASYAGGIPSLIDDRQTGCLFPTGDAPLLAESILRVFRDDEFASRLGRCARAEASGRHAPARVKSELLAAYRGVLAGEAHEAQSDVRHAANSTRV